jgi:hypothetical protein
MIRGTALPPPEASGAAREKTAIASESAVRRFLFRISGTR